MDIGGNGGIQVLRDKGITATKCRQIVIGISSGSYGSMRTRRLHEHQHVTATSNVEAQEAKGLEMELSQSQSEQNHTKRK